jgi:hypothetical protein
MFLLFVALVLLSAVARNDYTPTGWLFLLQQQLFNLAGLCVIMATVDNFLREKDAGAVLLLCWVSGVFVFSAMLNPFVATRYFLPLVPAAAIIFAKRIKAQDAGGTRVAFAVCLSIMLTISTWVMAADFHYANAVRQAAGDALKVWEREGGKLYFQGHWGLQYYLEAGGGEAIAENRPQMHIDDLIVTPSFNTHVKMLNADLLDDLQLITILPARWVSTFNFGVGAGFHSSVVGPLPYAFGKVAPDYLYVRKVKAVPNLDLP